MLQAGLTHKTRYQSVYDRGQQQRVHARPSRKYPLKFCNHELKITTVERQIGTYVAFFKKSIDHANNAVFVMEKYDIIILSILHIRSCLRKQKITKQS